MPDWPPKSLPRNFPLTIVKRGYMKRVAGKFRWICGKVSPAEALKVYHRKAAALVAGHKPLEAIQQPRGVVTLHYLLGRWVIDRRADAERGELSVGAFGQYFASANAIDEHAGHHVASDWTPDQTRELYNHLCNTRSVDFAKRAIDHLNAACRYAADQKWCAPVSLGSMRLTARAKSVMKWRLYTPAEVRRIRDAIDKAIRDADGRGKPSLIQLRAMIYLALNGGYGAKELADLPRAVVDLDAKVINHRRGKTGADHIVPLWPETIRVLKPVLRERVGDELLFRTREGNPWCYAKPRYAGGKLVGRSSVDNVGERFKDLVTPLGLRIPGQNFYKLRHLFATTADQFIDTHAVSVLMGHALPGSRGHYIRVSDERLRAVVAFVRKKLLV